MSVRDVLAAQPRVALGHWPTPIERCERLETRCELWIKRDDCTGLAFGGNKVRKLEFLLGKAIAEGAERVVGFGAIQSNHARLTAAACAKVGLGCDLVLTRVVPRNDDAYNSSGNFLLDGMFGATVHVMENTEAAVARWQELATERVFTILPGGSDPTGTLGYVDASFELAEQDASFDHIVLAASTGGTSAGLILGTSLAGIDATIDIACAYEPEAETRAQITNVMGMTAELLGVELPDEARWTITDSTLGDGYGIPTPDGLAAIDALATSEGILLDPVYTSKAFAFLLADKRFEGKRVLFIHTGGAPGLFAYPDEVRRP